MAQRLSLRNAALRFQDGGHVPGTGRGDKIPAKYEPGEFVVSNDMIDDNPGLREQLSSLRAETLAARGKTVEEADAKAMTPRGLRAVGGFDPNGEWMGDNRPVQPTTGRNTVDPAERLRAMNQAAKQARLNPPPPEPTAPPRPATPPPILDAERLRTAGVPPPTSVPLPPDQAAAYNNSAEGKATARAHAHEKFARAGGGSNVPPAAPGAAATASPGTGYSAARRVGEAVKGAKDWTLGERPAATTIGGKLGNAVGAASTAAGRVTGGLQVADTLRNNFDAMQNLAKDDRAGTSDYLAGGVEFIGNTVASGATALSKRFPVIGPMAAAYLGGDGASRAIEAASPGASVLRRYGLGGESKIPGASSIPAIADAVGVAPAPATATPERNAGAGRGFVNPPNAKPDLRNPYANVTPEQGRAMAEVNARAQQGQPQEQVMDGGIRRVDRPGQSPLFTNVADGGLLGNDNLMNRGAVSEQNLRALDAMDARQRQESMGRVQAQAQAQAQAPGQPQAPRSKSWEERAAQWNDPFSGVGLARRNMEVSLGSMIPYHLRGKDGPGEKLKEAQAASLGEFAKQHFGMAPGDRADSTERYKSDQSLRASLANSDAARYGHDSSFAGTKYTADASLMGKRAEQQYKLRQQQMMGQLWQESGGDPMKFQGLAMQYGLPDAAKAGGEMARGTQTYQHNAANNARKRLEGMAVQRNEKNEEYVNQGRLAKLESTLAKMAPNYQHLSEPEQAKLLGKAEASVNLLQGLNSRQNSGFWQAIGIDGDKAELNNIPHEAMKGAKLMEVGLSEGAFTGGGVSRNDYAIKTEGGHTLHIPRSTTNQGVLELLKELGVDVSGARK